MVRIPDKQSFDSSKRTALPVDGAVGEQTDSILQNRQSLSLQSTVEPTFSSVESQSVGDVFANFTISEYLTLITCSALVVTAATATSKSTVSQQTTGDSKQQACKFAFQAPL